MKRKRARVELRIHGPYRHRQQWRLDVFDRGKRSKRSFSTYAEALFAAHALLTGSGKNAQPNLLPAQSDVV